MFALLLLFTVATARPAEMSAPTAENVEFVTPCNGEVQIFGSGPYLVQIPTHCGGAYLIYCNEWVCRFLLRIPGAQCISFICPE